MSYWRHAFGVARTPYLLQRQVRLISTRPFSAAASSEALTQTFSISSGPAVWLRHIPVVGLRHQGLQFGRGSRRMASSLHVKHLTSLVQSDCLHRGLSRGLPMDTPVLQACFCTWVVVIRSWSGESALLWIFNVWVTDVLSNTQGLYVYCTLESLKVCWVTLAGKPSLICKTFNFSMGICTE